MELPEAASSLARANEAQEVSVTLYHCKGAGGPANGGRVGDVYEVAGQLVKSAYYCDVPTLVHQMEDRMHPINATNGPYFYGCRRSTWYPPHYGGRAHERFDGFLHRLRTTGFSESLLAGQRITLG